MRVAEPVLLLSMWVCDLQAATVAEWTERVEKALKETRNCPVVTPLSDDWYTGGDWKYRYGVANGVLCAMAGIGYPISDSWKHYEIDFRAYIGENCSPGDGVRIWIHWPYLPESVPDGISEDELEKVRGPLGKMAPAGMDLWTRRDVRRVLINPVNRGRRQANLDDHAEAYKPWFSREGPHLYCDLEIPEGLFRLSLYFVNHDSHWGGVNRFRDYRVQFKDWQPPFGKEPGWEKLFNELPCLAESRVRDFYTGVYKRFLVKGKEKLTLSIRKGDSLNTVLAGVFLDPWIYDCVLQVGGTNPEKGDPFLGLMDSIPLYPRAKLGRVSTYTLLARKTFELKKVAPTGLLELADELAGDAGKWVAQTRKVSAPECFDELEDLGTLFHILMEWDARDRVWAQHSQGLGEWLRSAPASKLQSRKDEFWTRCGSLRSRLGMTPTAVHEMHHEYFRSILEVCPEKEAIEKMREFAAFAAALPVEAHAALTVLEEYYQRKRPGPPYASFGPEELHGWGFCNSGIGNRIISAETWQTLVTKFPDHPSAKDIARVLNSELEQAKYQRELENPRFYSASGPAIVLPKTPGPEPAKQPSGPVQGRFDWEDPIRAHE